MEAVYEVGRVVALKMVHDQRPDDYAHSPGSSLVNQKRSNNRGINMKEMLPKSTKSSQKRYELSALMQAKRKEKEQRSLQLYNKMNNRAAKLNVNLPCSMAPLNNLRHQQETSHPALISGDAVKFVRELIEHTKKCDNPTHLDAPESVEVIVLSSTSDTCTPRGLITCVSEADDVASISEFISVPLTRTRTYGDTSGRSLYPLSSNKLEMDRDVNKEGEGCKGSKREDDCVVGKDLGDQDVVAISELLESNKEKQEALILQEKEMKLMTIENKCSLAKLESDKNIVIKELTDKLVLSLKQSKFVEECHKTKLLKYKHVIFMLRKQVNEEHSNAIKKIKNLQDMGNQERNLNSAKVNKLSIDIRELMLVVGSRDDQIKELNLELLEDCKEIDHMKKQMSLQQYSKDSEDTKLLQIVRNHIYKYLISDTKESGIHLRDTISRLAFNKEHLANILKAIKHKQLISN